MSRESVGIAFLLASLNGLDIFTCDYRQSGTDFWTKDIAKEMTNVRITFEKFDGVTPYEMSKG